jgi:hypothetical protein
MAPDWPVMTAALFRFSHGQQPLAALKNDMRTAKLSKRLHITWLPITEFDGRIGID